MTVIIPHPTEELLITKLQNSILEFYKEKDIKIFRSLPLWIRIPGDDIKNLNESTGTIELNEISFADGKISLTCMINEKKEKLPVAEFYRNESESRNSEKSEIPFEDELKEMILKKIKLPVVLKIYRIADADFQGNTWTVNNFIWKKNR